MQQLPALPGAAWLVPGTILGFIALGRPAWRWLATGLLAFAWTVSVAQRHLDTWLPAQLDRHDFPVYGWVDGFPTGTAVRKTFSFRVESAASPEVPRRLRLSWYDPPAQLVPGASLAVTVRLKRPRGLVNPGGFDYERWLLTQGYGATGYVRSGGAAPDRHWLLARAWLRMRARLAARIAAAAPTPSSAGLMIALVIGERYGFSDQEWTDLQRSGTSHLVAISGLNIGLAATVVFAAVRWLWLRLPGVLAMYDLEAAALASAAGAYLYTALAGFGVPAQRSLVMLAVALAVLMARRDVGAVNGLAVAALAVLVWDPFAPTSASFWLSFGAVALLLLIGTRREVGPAFGTRGARLRHWSRVAVSLQVAMSFGSIPFVALYFSRVSLVSPFANLLAVPYFNLALAPATLAGVLGVAAGVPGAVGLLHVAGRLADWAWAGIHFAASLPWASVGVAPPAPWSLGLALAGVAAALPAHRLPGRAWAWCALLPLLLARAPRPPPGAAEVTMLDVGHGLAVIVETRTHRLLYDAGPRSPSGNDSGREIVVPALSLEPRAGLDRLIVSHADADHSGGAASVLAAFPNADVLKGPDVAKLPGRTCAEGQHWTWDGVEFEMLYPPAGFPPLGNDSSCVLKITTAGGSMLLDGDIEARAEERLVAGGALAAEVVAVPHHGSPTSSTPRFVEHTGARFALVSAGFPSRWNFPRPEVVERWQAEGADVWVTGRSGALTVTFDRKGVRVVGERMRRKRYWRTFSEPSPGMRQQRAL